MGALPSHPSGFLFAGVVCSALALAFTVKALVPRWRHKGGWGRGVGVPITIVGHTCIALAFLILGASSFASYFGVAPGLAPVFPFFGFVVFIGGGVHDSVVAARRK